MEKLLLLLRVFLIGFVLVSVSAVPPKTWSKVQRAHLILSQSRPQPQNADDDERDEAAKEVQMKSADSFEADFKLTSSVLHELGPVVVIPRQTGPDEGVEDDESESSEENTTPIPNIVYKKPKSTVSPEVIHSARETTEKTTTQGPVFGELGNGTFDSEYAFTSSFLHDELARADCECGKTAFRIPVGDRQGINEYPWTAAIVRNDFIFGGGRPHCSGTLVNDRYILTAAHCMDGLSRYGMQVWLTSQDNLIESNKLSQGIIKEDIIDVLMHPNYNRRTKDNDIALLKLGRRIDISSKSYYVPACLPAGREDYSGATGRVAGWGSTEYNSNGRITNNKMCRTDVPVISNDVCNRDTRHGGKVTKNMMCAGLLTQNPVDTCQGDAGGPLIITNGGRHTLIGVVSWGFGKNEAYSPTVYSRVGEYSDWILHNTREADWCGI